MKINDHADIDDDDDDDYNDDDEDDDDDDDVHEASEAALFSQLLSNFASVIEATLAI